MRSHPLTRLSALASSILLAAALFCCTSREPAASLDEGERAGSAALACYKALYIENHAEKFLRGRVAASRLDDDQRRQLLQFYQHHVAQVGRLHGGVANIDFCRAQSDTALHLMQVFLKMTYGDATQEEIVVPMVQDGDEWKMK